MNSISAIMIATVVILAAVGSVSIYVGKKKKGADDWMVAGRSLPLYVVIGAQFAAANGGGVLVAHVGIGYSAGWSALTYGVLSSGGLLIFLFLAKWLRTQKFVTVPDIIKKLYGDHKFLVTLATLMTIIVPFGWVCTNLVAFGKLYSDITGISLPLLMVIFAIVSLIFILPAGLASVAWTDFIFGCIMIIMMVFTVIFALGHVGGWGTIANTVPHKITHFPKGMMAIGFTTVIMWFFSILPGTLTNQMYYQRIYAAKNVNIVKWSLVGAAVVGLLADVWASIMGITIHSMNPNLGNSEMAAGWFLTQLPIWFLALYSGFIISTIMSTISAAVQSVVVNITRDIYQSYINPEVHEKKLLNLSKLMSLIIVLIAILLSIFFPSALDWLVATYAYSASSLLVPIFLGFVFKKSKFLTQQGAIGSMIVGLLGSGIAQIVGTSIPYVVFGLIGSLIGMFVISFITKDKSQPDSAIPM